MELKSSHRDGAETKEGRFFQSPQSAVFKCIYGRNERKQHNGRFAFIPCGPKQSNYPEPSPELIKNRNEHHTRLASDPTAFSSTLRSPMTKNFFYTTQQS